MIGSMILFLIILLGIYLWVMNIYYLATSPTFTGMSMLRTIGIFFVPISFITGFVSNPSPTEKE